MRNIKAITAVILVIAISGCARDETPVTVRVISVKTPEQYKAIGTWTSGNTFPNTVVERLDTKERIMLRGANIGFTGEVFAVKACNLRWE
jgi:hypothetical protein